MIMSFLLILTKKASRGTSISVHVGLFSSLQDVFFLIDVGTLIVNIEKGLAYYSLSSLKLSVDQWMMDYHKAPAIINNIPRPPSHPPSPPPTRTWTRGLISGKT